MKKNKERTAVWLYPGTMERIDGRMEADNCKSRSETTPSFISLHIRILPLHKGA